MYDRLKGNSVSIERYSSTLEVISYPDALYKSAFYLLTLLTCRACQHRYDRYIVRGRVKRGSGKRGTRWHGNAAV